MFAAVALACGQGDGDGTAAGVIAFDLRGIGDDGLVGPSDGRRALHYEFCVPADPEKERQVRGIDPSVEVMRGSRGRIGCGPDEVLCVGSTHQPGWRVVLTRLAALPFVTRIARCDFE
jgi:hypothetical protein